MSNKSFVKSIGARLLMQIFAFIVLPFTIVIILLFVSVNNIVVSRQKDLSDKMYSQIDSSIRGNISLTKRITHSVLSNGELVRFMSTPYSEGEDYQQYITLIKGYITAILATDYRSDIRIYTVNTTIPMGVGIFYALDTVINNPAVLSFVESDETGAWLSEQDFNGSEYNPYMFSVTDSFVYLEKIRSSTLDFLGIITFSIPERHFFGENTDKVNVQSVEKTRIINMTQTVFDSDALTELIFADRTYYSYKSMYIQNRISDGFPFQIIIISPADISLAILKIVSACMLVFLCLSVFAVIRSIRVVTHKMNECVNEMDASISNNFVGRLNEQGQDEIGRIAGRINLLLDKITDQIQLVIKKETASKEAQIMALQHQINPHFIYNTLEVFSSKMKLHGHYAESEALVSFANIFRYNVSSAETLVTVEEEIRQSYNYMNIQNLSYPNITLSTAIPAELLDTKIPKFIFQPLIENSILHGTVSKTDRLSIMISAERIEKTNRISFSVADNGLGFSEDDAEQLTAALSSAIIDMPSASDGQRSIGLSNINSRLRLHYGDDAYITARRKEGRTVIHFTIED